MEYSEIAFACLQLLFTGIICFATWKYTSITSKTLEEIRREREYRETPDINIRFKEESGGTHTLEFKNISKTEILNLKIDVENADNVMINKNCKLSDYGFLKNEIKYMGVDQVYEIKNINMYEFVKNYEHIGSLKFAFTFYSKYNSSKLLKKDVEYNLSQFKDTATVLDI